MGVTNKESTDWHKEMRDAYDSYPSQDNEGYSPDRGGFKAGWFACLAKANEVMAKERLRERTKTKEAVVVLELALENLAKIKSSKDVAEMQYRADAVLPAVRQALERLK